MSSDNIYPEIYLSIDNCFASKRWTEPEEWMNIIRQLGLHYVEASADTECDPLYAPQSYREDWIKKAQEASLNTGVNISQMYSGHGTYATLGLGHTDVKVRRHMMEQWLKVMCEQAGSFGAYLGFFCHAFSQTVLQDRILYKEMLHKLYMQLAQVADWAKQYGCAGAGVETMYSPHQVPWTITGAQALLKEVNRISKAPFYLSIDVGHQVGQSRFTQQTLDEMELDPHLFSAPEDSKTENWLEQLGCYSPIVHLQQTDGTSSKHLPFTPENNAFGVINGEMVLRALRRSYETIPEDDMPPKTQKIFLTLEIFSGTADKAEDILSNLMKSVEYWRRYVPEDGMTLDQLTKS